MGEAQTIFTDRYNDMLQIVLRDLSEHGNPIPDPVISVKNTLYGTTHSVVMNDEELDNVLRDLCESFGYIAFKNETEPKLMEQVVAYLTLSVVKAIPEQEDFDRGRKIIAWLEAELKKED